jgi:hypothetical protein
MFLRRGIEEGMEGMLTCERCNTENLEGSQYCDECGAILGGAPARSTRVESGVKEGDGMENAGEPRTGHVEQRQEMAEARVGRRTEAGTARSSPAVHVTAHEASGNVLSLPVEDGPHAKLVIHRGRSVGKEFPMLDDETHIGRWDADGGIFPDVDLDADDPEAKVSRRHARITRRGELYFIEDLGSTNGTFINRGRRLLPGDRQPLRDGDEVIVGKTFLRFHIIK